MTEALDTPILTLQLLFTTAERKRCSGSLSRENQNYYSQPAARSRSSLKAQKVNDKIANKRVKG
jgi:hypothetical protein